MKKFITALTLVAAAATASAGDLTGIVKYDYDRVEHAPFASLHQAKFGLAYAGQHGAVDGSLVAAQQVGAGRVNGTGFELGYSNGLTIGKLGLTGRVGFTQVQFEPVGGRSDVYSAAVRASYPLDAKHTAVGEYEYRHYDIEGADPKNANRFGAGVRVAVTDKVAVTGLAFRTRIDGRDANGLSVRLGYKF